MSSAEIRTRGIPIAQALAIAREHERAHALGIPHTHAMGFEAAYGAGAGHSHSGFGAGNSLFPYVNVAQLICLNEKEEGAGKRCIKPYGERETSQKQRERERERETGREITTPKPYQLNHFHDDDNDDRPSPRHDAVLRLRHRPAAAPLCSFPVRRHDYPVLRGRPGRRHPRSIASSPLRQQATLLHRGLRRQRRPKARRGGRARRPWRWRSGDILGGHESKGVSVGPQPLGFRREERGDAEERSRGCVGLSFFSFLFFSFFSFLCFFSFFFFFLFSFSFSFSSSHEQSASAGGGDDDDEFDGDDFDESDDEDPAESEGFSRLCYLGFKGAAKKQSVRGAVKGVVYEITGSKHDHEVADDEKMKMGGMGM